jgi:PAS domain S-box-containing protein
MLVASSWLLRPRMTGAFSSQPMPAELPPTDQLWSAFVQCALDGIAVIERDFTIRFASRLWPGHKPEDVVGQSALKWVPADYHDQARRLLEQAWDSPQPVEGELPALTPEGGLGWLLIRVVPVRNQGQTVALLACTRDTTGQHRAEEALLPEAELLAGAEEERRRGSEQRHEVQKVESLAVLAGGLAHNFNNLLTTVLGYADLAEWQLPAGSPLRAYMQNIGQAARRAAGLCQQLLAYAGKVPLAQEVLDLVRLLRDSEPALRALLPVGAQLSVDLPPEMLLVAGDAGLLRQVLLNLVQNAAEALGELPGQITVRLASRHLGPDELAGLQVGSDRPPGEYAVLEVSDTGCGMDEATRARIFEPFFTTRFTGRGLGLAAVLGIVGAHKGAVDVVSAPGQGSTFRLFLPHGK